MAPISLITIFLLISYGLADSSCNTKKIKRKTGSFGITEEGRVSNGTKATLSCDPGRNPGSILNMKLVSDPVIECLNGKWIPPKLYHCFKDCTGKAIRRRQGDWKFDPESVDNLTFVHGTEAMLECPEGYFLGNRARKTLDNFPPAVCVNGRWRFNKHYCWQGTPDSPLVFYFPPGLFDKKTKSVTNSTTVAVTNSTTAKPADIVHQSK